MPRIQLNGANLHYEDTGGSGAPVLFCHGLLWSSRMFDDQVAALRGRYRCVAFDFRGQGQSEVTASGYDMDSLTADAAALIETLDLGPCHVAGLSMGGFVAMRLAARRPELVSSLMLLETSADAEPAENVPKYRLLGTVARWLGFTVVAWPVMKIMFGKKFLADPSRADLRRVWRDRLIANNRAGFALALKGVIERAPIADELGRVQAPTLVIVGDQDVATVPAKAQRIHERIRGSRLLVIPGAGHTSSVEQPAAVLAAMADFLASVHA